jgi:hypothetical protein
VVHDHQFQITVELLQTGPDFKNQIGIFAKMQAAGNEQKTPLIQTGLRQVVTTSRRHRLEEMRSDCVMHHPNAGADRREKMCQAIR